MGITVRDLYFILRAKDEASTVINNVGRDLVRLSSSAEAASLRARAAEARQLADTLKSTGATRDEIDMVNRYAKSLENEADRIDQAYQKHLQMVSSLRDMSRLLALVGVAMTGVGIGILGALATTVQAAQEYGRQVALTKTQVDGFSASIQQLGDLGKQVANDIAVPFKEIQPTLYNIFSSTDANLQQATVLLNAFAKAAVAGQVSIEDASKGTIAIMNGLNIPFEKVNDVLDIEFQLVRKGVGTYEDFNSVLGRIIPSANRAGQNFQTVAAMLAFLTRNGLSAAMAATSGARALDAFSNPNTVAKLQQIGIKVSDVKGNFLPLVDILQQLYDRMKPLGDLQRSELLQQLLQGSGGTIQARRFIDQVLQPGEFEQFMGFLNDMNNATGQFQGAYETMASTTANRTQLLKNRFDVLKVTVGQVLTPTFNAFIDVVSNLVDKFNKLDPATQGWIVKSAAVAGAFSVVAGAATLAASAVGYVSAGLAALGIEIGPAIAIVLAVVGAIVGIGYAFVQLYRHSAEFRDFWKAVIDDVITAYNMLKDTAIKIKNDFTDRLGYALERLKVALDDLGTTFDSWFEKYVKKHKKDFEELLNSLEMVASKGFYAISSVIQNLLIPAILELNKLYHEHQKGIDQVIDALTWFGKEIAKFAGGALGTLLVGALIGVIALFYAVIVSINETIKVVSAIAKAISTFIGWIKDLIGWIRSIPDPLHIVSGAFDAMRDSASSAINGLMGTVSSIPGRIQSAVGSLRGILYQAGRNVIQGLIDGIMDGIGALGSVLGFVGNYIKDHKGPREKDLKLLVPAGAAIMQGLINGMKDMVPTLSTQLQNITGGIGPQVIGSQAGSGVTKVVNQNITVNQAQKSARQLAMELGFELAGSI